MTNALASATANITWQGPNGTVVASQSIMSPTATASLMFQPFEASDFGEYSCSATITSPQLPGTVTRIGRSLGILGTLLYETTYMYVYVCSYVTHIVVSLVEMATVSISEVAPSVVGEPYTLTCRVDGTGGTPSIEWIGPNSQPIVSGQGVTVGNPVTVGMVTTSTLMFSAISLLDSGRYMCRTPTNTAARTITVEGEE